MEQLCERMGRLTHSFSEMVCSTLNEMMDLNYVKVETSFSTNPFHKGHGIIVVIHFGGTIQGDCFLILPRNTTSALIRCLKDQGAYSENDTEQQVIEELLSEVLNTSVGRLLPQLEREIESVSYMPPIIVSGEIIFPRVASNSIRINGSAGEMTCVFALNMVNLKITQTLKSISEDLAVKTKQAKTDSLTGLNNRMHFDEVFNVLVESAGNGDMELSIMILDVDNLKKINDTLGHQVGDTVIVTVADTVITSLRSEDIPCRYGGDEIVVLLPNTTLSNTKNVTARIRNCLEEKGAKLRKRIRKAPDITMSIGVAQLEGGETSEEFFNRADRALYAAKKAGRNRVRFSLPDGIVKDI
jgi:diguanylate cyclase (GGDEF)-like protein